MDIAGASSSPANSIRRSGLTTPNLVTCPQPRKELQPDQVKHRVTDKLAGQVGGDGAAFKGQMKLRTTYREARLRRSTSRTHPGFCAHQVLATDYGGSPRSGDPCQPAARQRSANRAAAWAK